MICPKRLHVPMVGTKLGTCTRVLPLSLTIDLPVVIILVGLGWVWFCVLLKIGGLFGMLNSSTHILGVIFSYNKEKKQTYVLVRWLSG